MITSAHVRAVSKMTKAQLIEWLEAHGSFSLIRGWRDHSKDELQSEVLEMMGREWS